MRSLGVITAAGLCLATVHIWEPPSLRQLYSDRELVYSITNFGSVPYGRSVYGTVLRAAPPDACAPVAPPAARPPDALILLVDRGGCHFAEKALNAQRAGARLAIFADDGDDVSKVIPVENSELVMSRVRIPSILISRPDADNFLRVLESRQPHLSLAVNFPLFRAADGVQVKQILQPDDPKSLRLALALARPLQRLAPVVAVGYHVRLFRTAAEGASPDSCYTAAELAYCLFPAQGQQRGVIGEAARHLCLISQDKDLYVGFLARLQAGCFGGDGPAPGFAECSGRQWAQVPSSPAKLAVDDCMGDRAAKDRLFERNSAEVQSKLINYSPLLFINDFIFRGNHFETAHVLESICDSLDAPPAACLAADAFREYRDFRAPGPLRFALLAALCCLALAAAALLAFYLAYRLLLKRRYQLQLAERLNLAMSKYLAAGDGRYQGVAFGG